jgi:shikimate kinase
MNIYLLGYRGSGKTTLGKALAREMGLLFVDSDEMVVKKANASIPEIFERQGESGFRERESEVLKEIASSGHQVVSTGGGIVLLEKNRELIRKTGRSVYLFSKPETIYQRIYGDRNRPALSGLSLKEEIVANIEVRAPFYEELSDLKVDTERSVLECVKEIKDKMGLKI